MGNDVRMDLWGVGEIESDKKPSQRGEHDCGGSLAGTELRSMSTGLRFSRLLPARTSSSGR